MKKITILHANDLHNELNFEVDKDYVLHGGVSMLSSYVKGVREKEDNVFFGISGDILQEDIWGSDYKGLNTVNVLNCISPDAISLGNHELDYGLAHLLVFKECLASRIVNANIEVGLFEHNLFESSFVYESNDVKMLVIGIIPERFFKNVASDEFCRNMLVYNESYAVIREEIHKHKDEDIDLVCIMSHYGLDGDVILAQNMPEDIHVDLILGGHTHIDMEEPKIVNEIVIAQSSYGTTHIGRFDIEIDDEKHCIKNYTWTRVPITSENCSFDDELDELADKVVFNKKKMPKEIIARFKSRYVHDSRINETELGDIIADAFKDIYKVDLVILQSGSIRKEVMEEEITQIDLKEMYPYDDRFVKINLSGSDIEKMFSYMFSDREDGNLMSGNFQYSDGFRLVVDFKNKANVIEDITFGGKKLIGDKIYSIGITQNCLNKFYQYFNIIVDCPDDRVKTLSYSTFHDLQHWFLMQEKPIEAPTKGRFLIKEN